MKTNLISMPSAWGRNAVHKHVTNSEPSLVVIFPGLNYSCERPLLHYAAQSALEHHHDLLLLEYGFQSARCSFDESELNILIYECKHAIDQVKDKYDTILCVSKSIGTLVAGQVAELLEPEPLRHLFLTPLNRTIPYIENSNCTVIYGTNDPVFSEGSAELIQHATQAAVYPLEQAGHGLEGATLDESIDLLRKVSVVYQEFFS